ncbi:hypothetical protein OIU91_06000 [Streptomyces sp. NBC_01456]|uniref:hypothetical protein n=1 Tax=Streptomyces sp. NBC_01456 TaxID=2975868 RepID=UPI002E2EB2FA|nr:hypothetical protein [Streptomyces sp. NBC_01456]
MTLKESAADHAARTLRTVFDQLDNGVANPEDVRAANSAMDLADVFGVTAQDYARILSQAEPRP